MRLLLLLLLLAAPGIAAAQGDEAPNDGEAEAPEAEAEAPEAEAPEAGAEAPEAEAPNPGQEAAPESAVDAFTARLLLLVDRYHEGVDHTPTEQERARALDSIRTMLLDGVALPRVHAAVDEAVRLHAPGRVVPFHIAVPLRVKPADLGQPARKATPDPAPSPARTIDPRVEARRAEQRQAASARRNRVRLYEQWQSRTRHKRALATGGAIAWAVGYGAGFGLGGITVLSGQATHEQAWLRAIPLVGQFLYVGSLAEGGVLALDGVLLGLVEVSGATLVAISIAIKADWPYDRDPTALRLQRPDGRLAVEASPILTPAFAGLTGRF